MTLTIFTSLPPGMNRFDHVGNNIGATHYRRCLQSWLDNGFEIVSINSVRESKGAIEAEFPIKRITVDRDAKEICGKPLVYFSDFMKTIFDHASGPVIITNADIELNLDKEDLNKIRLLERGTFICERRRDYQNGNKTISKPYEGGFDFFVLHRDDLYLHFECCLTFGMPWWDHYIPVILLSQNFQQIHLSEKTGIFHLDHEERWDMKNFRLYGARYRQELERMRALGQNRIGFETMMRRIAAAEAYDVYFPYARRHNFIPNLLRFKPKDKELNRLFWIAFNNFRLMQMPDEKPMRLLSISRFLQRLPF